MAESDSFLPNMVFRRCQMSGGASGIFYKERTGYYHTQLDFSAHISKLNLVEILSHYKFYVWMSTITATTYTHGAATVKIPGIIRLCHYALRCSFF